MTDKHPKRPRDPNQLAKSIIHLAPGAGPPPTPEEQGKDPAAVAMSNNGGRARADTLAAEKRLEIPKKAAAKRWSVDQASTISAKMFRWLGFDANVRMIVATAFRSWLWRNSHDRAARTPPGACIEP
jgi:hypothetical protein